MKKEDKKQNSSATPAKAGVAQEFPDFNDLAMKSALGREGVKRQVRAVIDIVIERRQALAG